MWTLSPKTSILIRRRKYGHGHRETYRESYVMMDAAIGVISLQAKECQGSLANIRSWKRQGRILP